MTWPSARSGAVKMTIALCIAPKPEGVALIGRWSANDRVYHRDAAKAMLLDASPELANLYEQKIEQRAEALVEHRAGLALHTVREADVHVP